MKQTNLARNGFSLIEMVVVMFLFAVLAFIVTQSNLQVFRGARKIDASSKVRDNLDFAMSTIDRNIRNAKSIITPCNGTSSGTLSYVDQSGATDSYICSGGSNQYVTDGSSNARVTSSDVALTTCSFKCTSNGAYNPPVIDITFSGVASGAEASDQSFSTVTHRVVLRVY